MYWDEVHEWMDWDTTCKIYKVLLSSKYWMLMWNWALALSLSYMGVHLLFAILLWDWKSNGHDHIFIDETISSENLCDFFLQPCHSWMLGQGPELGFCFWETDITVAAGWGNGNEIGAKLSSIVARPHNELEYKVLFFRIVLDYIHIFLIVRKK